MARTTLSEQNAALQSTIEALRAQISSLQHRIDSQQRELDNQTIAKNLAFSAQQADFDKKLKEKDDSKRWSDDLRTKAESELEQAHAVLDSVPDAPARTYEDKTSSYSSEKHRNVVTRLAGAFLAITRGDVKVAQ